MSERQNIKNHMVRIGECFNKEIEEIKKTRLESGIDIKKKSTRLISNLIVKHISWKKIKEEIKTLNQEKINKILRGIN